MLAGRRVVVMGGTGSLGRALVHRLLVEPLGPPERIVVFSRSEATQHQMRLDLQNRRVATDDIVYEEARFQRVVFRIGDVGDYAAVASVLRDADVVFNAAAMKQVPTCEYHPWEAVKTNVLGAENVVRAIRELRLPVSTVVGIATDKACKPVNVMGMTKAIQERIFIHANLECPGTRFVVARYGNVLASRGSVIPVFREQIAAGGPVTLTTPEMTRFLMTLDQAVDTILAALREGEPGETYLPRVPAARIVDVAAAMIGDRPVETKFTGIRPGEKVHEILVSEEESPRTYERGDYLVTLPILPELRSAPSNGTPLGQGEYCSADHLLDAEGCRRLLAGHGLLPGAPQDGAA